MAAIFKKFTPISAALLPNAESDDVAIVLRSFLPWNWRTWQEGKEIVELENKFKKYFGIKYAIGFSSGRVGFYAILKSLSGLQPTTCNLQPGEVILQAYTTIALPIAIKQAGFVPVYVDIKEDTYNIDPDKIEAKITKNTKAIIVQHTFGMPAEMDKISEICKKHNLFLIEDCAHSLGAEYGSRKVGTFGDAAFFSFGRDKIISSTSGGMVIIKNKKLAEKIKEFQNGLDFPPFKWISQQLLHPLVFWFSLPIYYLLNIGKLKIYFWQKLGLIHRAYSQEEKKGTNIKFNGYKFPNILAVLVLNQFNKIERFNVHRQKIAEIYIRLFSLANKDKKNDISLPRVLSQSKPTFLYYTVQVENRDELLNLAAGKHIILGDWFPGALGPKGVDMEKFGYKKGDCPVVERVGIRSLNLPTNIKTPEEDAEKVAVLINEFVNKK